MNKWLPLILVIVEKVLPIVLTTILDDKKKESNPNPKTNEKTSDSTDYPTCLVNSSDLYSGDSSRHLDCNTNQ